MYTCSNFTIKSAGHCAEGYPVLSGRIRISKGSHILLPVLCNQESIEGEEKASVCMARFLVRFALANPCHYMAVKHNDKTIACSSL